MRQFIGKDKTYLLLLHVANPAVVMNELLRGGLARREIRRGMAAGKSQSSWGNDHHAAECPLSPGSSHWDKWRSCPQRLLKGCNVGVVVGICSWDGDHLETHGFPPARPKIAAKADEWTADTLSTHACQVSPYRPMHLTDVCRKGLHCCPLHHVTSAMNGIFLI